MRKFGAALILVSSLGLAACAGQSDTTQRTLSGTAIGAAGGLAIGAMTGSPMTGAAVGAAAGAAGGYIYDQHKKSQGQ